MANVIEGNIKTIKLSNDKIYAIFDQGALRLDPTTKKIITGVAPVDEVLLDGDLYITEIDNIPLADTNYKVITQNVNGKIIKEDIRKVLKNLGVITANVSGNTLDLEVVDWNSSMDSDL